MNTFNLPSAEQKDVELALLASIASNISDNGMEINSWKDLQMVTRMGLHKQFLKVGDALKVKYDDVDHILDVIGIDHEGGNSVTVQFRDCIVSGQFDAPEALYYASEELPAGTHIFTLNDLKYKFTTNEVIPKGGQVYVASWQGDTYVPTSIATYGADRTTIIESALDVTTSTGDDTLTPINNHTRCRYGSNNYMESAVRQWLNSDEGTFVWEPQTDFDRPPTSEFPTAGFLGLVEPEFASVISLTEKQVARNTITDGGGQDTLNDKVFLLSRVEVGLGSEGSTDGEVVYEFWNNSTNADRIKLLGYSPRVWWLRSPGVGFAGGVRSVSTSGVLTSYNAVNAGGLSPACTIS